MPRKLPCNGFSMFATEKRAELEAACGRRFKGMEELIGAATPLWAGTSQAEKRLWKARAKEYKRTEEFKERKRAFRRLPQVICHSGTGAPAPIGAPEPTAVLSESEQEDYDDDFDPGVPMARPPPSLKSPKQRIRAALSGRDAESVRGLRWLVASVSTFGSASADAPAEVGLVEWSLAGGILEEYHRCIGGWSLSPSQAEVAEKEAARSHGIPLAGIPGHADFATSRLAVLRNLLARSEPGLAWAQGLRCGLYNNATTEPDEEDFVADEHGRRPLIVLDEEAGQVKAAIAKLCQEESMCYEGFPLDTTRYWPLSAFAEALGQLGEENGTVWAGRGRALLKETSGRWDDVTGMYCSYHAPLTNHHCAIAKARKGAFGLFKVLKAVYDLPFHF